MMRSVIRVVIFLVILGALARAAGWIADQQGSVTIVWLGRQITSSIPVMIWSFVPVAVLGAILWSILGIRRRSTCRAIPTTRRCRCFSGASSAASAGGAGVGLT